MANWKLGKIQHGFTSTATSAGTLTLVKGSKQFQILTGVLNHTVQLPDATVVGVSGISFTVCNQSTGIITVNYNDATLLATIPAGQSLEVILTSIATTNGVWRTVSTGGSGGLASIVPGSVITSDYTVVAGDNGRVLNVDTTSGPIAITLIAPVAGFKVTIKDDAGTAATNFITIKRAGSELIDFTASDDEIKIAYKSVSLVSNGTDWFRVTSFVGVAPAVAGRGLFAGGYSGAPSAVIDYVARATLSNATNFGNLTVARFGVAGCSSTTRGLFGGGSTGAVQNVIDYVTISTTANAVDFGDLTVARRSPAACSSSTRGLWAGGSTGSDSNVIDYVAIATTGNATAFGDLTVARNYLSGCASPTRGLFGGGLTGSPSNIIDYVTIASAGNATDFGDLTVARQYTSSCSSATRGLFGGGSTGSDSNVIDYVTIASIGNATDFGDLTVARLAPAGCASPTRGLFGGGLTGSPSNIIDYVTIASAGNATDFGDLTVARYDFAGCSNVHGGL